MKRGLAALWARRASRPGAWGADCPGGRPVPLAWRCAALDCDSVPLTTLGEGCAARVTCLVDPGAPAAAHLAALGVLPGIEIVLVQRYPAFVFRLGFSEFALDADLAGLIRVRVES